MSCSQASTCCHSKIPTLIGRNEYKFCPSRIGAILPVCRKPVPKANKEQNAKARAPGENKLLPTAIPRARTQEPGEGGNGRHPVPGDSGLPAGPATSPGRAGLRSAGACAARPGRPPARWKAEPNGQGRQAGSVPRSQGREPDPGPAPTVLNARQGLLAWPRVPVPGRTVHASTACARDSTAGLRSDPNHPAALPAGPPTWRGRRPLAPASHPTARQHLRRCQPDAYLGARESVCVAVGKCRTGLRGAKTTARRRPRRRRQELTAARPRLQNGHRRRTPLRLPRRPRTAPPAGSLWVAPGPAPPRAPPTGSLVAPRPSRERRLNSSVYLGPEVLLPGYSAPAPLGAGPAAPSCFPLHSPTRENGILVTRCSSLILRGGRPRSGDEPAKVVLSNPQLQKGTPFTNATGRGLALFTKISRKQQLHPEK